jgi:hypothetical protein
LGKYKQKKKNNIFKPMDLTHIQIGGGSLFGFLWMHFSGHICYASSNAGECFSKYDRILCQLVCAHAEGF